MKKLLLFLFTCLLLIPNTLYALDGPENGTGDNEIPAYVSEYYNNYYQAIANDESLPKHINVDQRPDNLPMMITANAYVTEQAWTGSGITIYKQQDYDDEIAGCGNTIKGVGCLLTSVAMVLSKYTTDRTPAELNTTLGDAGFDGCKLIWSSLNQFGFSWTRWSNTPGYKEANGMDVIEGKLKTGVPILVSLVELSSGDTHWVVCYGYEHYSDGGEYHYIFNPSSASPYQMSLEQYMNGWYIEGFAMINV